MGNPLKSTGAEPDSSQLNVGHLRTLVEASKILNSTLELDPLLGIILEVATRELHADRGTVYLLDKPSGKPGRGPGGQ